MSPVIPDEAWIKKLSRKVLHVRREQSEPATRSVLSVNCVTSTVVPVGEMGNKRREEA